MSRQGEVTRAPSVLVTGGTLRLGAAIAARLRADGWRVVTSSHRAEAGADLVADLSRPEDADALFDAACAFLGGMPDALVNNAALYFGNADAVLSVGLLSPRRLTARMASRAAGSGVVVNILDASVGRGRGDLPGRDPAYVSAKRRLTAETRRAARRFAATLRVNGVAPGPVLAPVGLHERATPTPLGRPTPEDVAAAVSFLLQARRTSGCILSVSGDVM